VGGGGGWPYTFDDVAAAVRTVPELVAQRRPSTGVVLMGHSAGGQLALWAARGGAAVVGVVALAPVADMARGFAMKLGDGAVGKVLGGSPAEVPERYAAVDPAANLPLRIPTAVVHGHDDQQVPYAIGRDWAAESVAAGDPTQLWDLPGIEHFGVIDPLSSAWTAVTSGLASVCAVGRG
jgi:acetyl esterase/lipase